MHISEELIKEYQNTEIDYVVILGAPVKIRTSKLHVGSTRIFGQSNAVIVFMRDGVFVTAKEYDGKPPIQADWAISLSPIMDSGNNNMIKDCPISEKDKMRVIDLINSRASVDEMKKLEKDSENSEDLLLLAIASLGIALSTEL